MRKRLFVLIFLLSSLHVLAEGVYTEEIGYSVELLEDNQIFMKKITVIYRDGIMLTRVLHKKLFEPGMDVTNETEKVKKVADAIWTEEIIKEFKRKEKEKEEKLK